MSANSDLSLGIASLIAVAAVNLLDFGVDSSQMFPTIIFVNLAVPTYWVGRCWFDNAKKAKAGKS